MSEALEEVLQRAEENYLPASGKCLGAKAQMLSDLGYLNTEILVEISQEHKIDQAYQLFFSELNASGLISSVGINKINTIYQDQASIKFLEAATDIDEGLQINKLPELGEYGLTSKIIHYRLALLGLYTGPVELCYNAFSFTGLEQAASYIQQSKLDTINMLADLQSYTTAFLEVNGYNNSIVVFKSGISGKNEDYPEYSGKFKRQLKQDLEGHISEFEILDDHLFRRKDEDVDLDFLKNIAGQEINRFILRLIQLHQWMAGYYNGSLDSEYGKYTIDSLIEIIENYNEGSENKIRTADVFARVRDDYFIFNSLYFLHKYKEENTRTDQTMNTLQILSDCYAKADAKDQKVFETNFQAGIDLAKNGQDTLPEKKNGVIRRVFFGVSVFFKKAFRFARRLFRWVVQQVHKATNFVSNAIRMIYTYLKEAVRHFIEGVKFLLGKLPVTTQSKQGLYMYSNFDLDKDGLNIFGTADAIDIKNHMDLVWKKVHSMSFSLAVIGFLYAALKVGMSAATVIGWPLFILKLVMSFKKVIDSYKTILTT